MSPKPITQNTLFYGDNLPLPPEASVRLIWATAACPPRSAGELGR
jgi:hypothetical protein